ncbi:MAG: DUF3105 domain-containing protein [Propionibacteriales bacterium]|nr:DUF3105 domain-containing protein [Propionibacteriales bacterium]
MSKSNKNRGRRETVEQMRRQAQAQERRRTLLVVGSCVVVAVLIVGFAVFTYVQGEREKAALAAKDLADIGVAAERAGCTPVQEEPARGQSVHVETPVIYDTVPPAYGPHNPAPDNSGSHFYTADDRPPLEVLVHNLEHGWTLVWYDESVADDDGQMTLLRATAEKFDASSDPRNNVIIAPWTKDDGEGQPIPEGKHVAFTHWSIHQPVYAPPTGAEPVASFGVSQYCGTFSGAALDDFRTKFPYDDAPEGFIWHQ